MDKTLLRDYFRRKLREIPAQDRQLESEKIVQTLQDYLADKKGFWSLYYPLDDEPNILKCLQKCPEVNWVFPRVKAQGDLAFFQVKSLQDMAANSWGLVQPDPARSEEVSGNKISGYIIPALAYDSFGVRLGRGGGYYDQTLKSLPGKKIGVIFSLGISQEPLPKEDHDQCMDIVISSNKWIDVKEVKNANS